MKTVELLSPAKNLECGMAAIDCGADAVYIGAPAFSARSAAGNSIADIEKLAQYAHFYNAKVFVALNTILYNEELEDAVKLAWDVYNAGVDALIIQDMGLLECDLPPFEIHASTQTDNRDVEKVKFLESVGFSQIVLARELGLEAIKNIRSQVKAKLEYFIHGALCVSYSGQCYMSQYATGRSANRGECSQMCRHAYDLIDGQGMTVEQNKFLLSLRDLNMSNHIDELIDAGVDSFKIEGRLKDVAYVKNITSHFRRRIDEALVKRPNITRSSSGISTVPFEPQTDKTFARPFTDYYFSKERNETAFIDSPKSLGEYVGRVAKVNKNFIEVESDNTFNNGDGLCFFDKKEQLTGVRINRAEGKKLFVNDTRLFLPKTKLYRNHDIEFEKTLNSAKISRKIKIAFSIEEADGMVMLTAEDENKNTITVKAPTGNSPVKDIARYNELVKTQLMKLGATRFYATDVVVSGLHSYMKASELNQLRREAIEKLEEKRVNSYINTAKKIVPNQAVYYKDSLTYEGNVANDKARQFYEHHGVKTMSKAYELAIPRENSVLMTTKYCIKYQLGSCPKEQTHKRSLQEPLFIKDNTGKYQLQFDCKSCEMKVLST